MKVLLTGASGFIGRPLLAHLLGRGHHVTLLSRQGNPQIPSGAFEIIAPLSNWPQAVRGKSFDACIHLAWIATPGIYLESPENILFAETTNNLAQALFEAGLPHFIAAGTCIEYAPLSSDACDEKSPVGPLSSYGRAKEKARASIAEAARLHRKGYTWLRLFYPYGVDEDARRIPSTFLRTLGERRTLVLKTPDSIKDFIEIRDVVTAVRQILELGEPQTELNLGTGQKARIIELANMAAAITGADPGLVQRAETSISDPYAFHVADISKLTTIGWQPTISLREGMERLSATLRASK